MSYAFRCVIFAAVSTPSQANDNKASIPSQIANAQDLIARRGWEEVESPLIVPGLSRSIDWLHEAINEIPALNDLIELAKSGRIDLVVVRDYDRLSRTRSLLTQISTYLSRCHVQIYAMDKPIEPLDPSQLTSRQAAMSSATIEAFAALEAEREVARIAERRYFGMNGLMKKGIWHHARCPYGYTRKSNYQGNTVYLDIPFIVESERLIISRVEDMYLNGDSYQGIAKKLNLQKVPSAKGVNWLTSAVRHILTNPFYSGWIVWGIKRRHKVFDPTKDKFVYKAVYVPAYQRLTEQLGCRPTLTQLIQHIEELSEDDVVIVKGQHEAIRTLERQRAIDEEIYTRRKIGGRGSSLKSKNIYPFTGIMRCADCGSTMTAKPDKMYNRVYYICRGRCNGVICSNDKQIRQDYALQRIYNVLAELAQTPGAIDVYMKGQEDQDRANLEAEKASLSKAITKLTSRRTRWDTAYETEVITLEKYQERLTSIEKERIDAIARLEEIDRQLNQSEEKERRRAMIEKVIQSPPPLKDLKLVKRYFRKLFDSIIVYKGEITEVNFKF